MRPHAKGDSRTKPQKFSEHRSRSVRHDIDHRKPEQFRSEKFLATISNNLKAEIYAQRIASKL
jgi:hypothetical protein